MDYKTQKLIGALRGSYGYSSLRDKEAAGMIESLYAELEAAKEREKGLEIMLTSAQSAAETYKRERDAAIADLKEADRLECEHCRSYGLCQVAEGEDIDCETCTRECKCRECRNNDQWQWRGVMGNDDA